MKCLQIIDARCGEWAKSHFGKQYAAKTSESRGRFYVREVNDNFFGGLDTETEKEFQAGDGGELKSKAFALHSSSVLAVNFCQHWRRTSHVAVLAQALVGDDSASRLTFESRHATGVARKANLDFELHGGRKPVGVEAKFCEPFGAPKKKDFFRPAYFENGKLWAGLSRCRRLAMSIEERADTFVHLDAAQLLKHALALTRSYGPKGFDLMLLWYAPTDSAEAAAQVNRMKCEIEQFGNLITGEVAFVAETYQAVFDRLTRHEAGNVDYFSFLRNRYFGST